MAKTKLFEAWSFRLQQPAPFDDPKYAGSKSMGFSQYNTSSTAQKSTLHIVPDFNRFLRVIEFGIAVLCHGPHLY